MQDLLTNPFIMFIPVGLIFYFLVIQPQNRRMKELRQTIENVKRGDTVVTAGGIVGKVAKVQDDGELMVEISDNVQVRVIRATLTEVRTKGQPAERKS